MGLLDWLAGISAHDAPIDEEYDRRAKREFAFEDARKDIQDTLRREGIEKTYEPSIGVWKTVKGERHPDLSNMEKWGHAPGGKRDLRALKLALEKYPDFDPVKLGAVREHWASPKMRSKTAWPAAPADAPHALESAQSPVEMALWWGPMLAKLGLHGAKALAARKLRGEVLQSPAGKPQQFYHGTPKQFKGDIRPTKPRSMPSARLFMSNRPERANYYAVGRTHPSWVSAKDIPGARVYPKYIRPLPQKNPGFQLRNIEPMPNSYKPGLDPFPPPVNAPPEIHAIINDPRVLVPPYAIAPPAFPNVLPQFIPPALPHMEPDQWQH